MIEKLKHLAYKILRVACIFYVYRRGLELPTRTIYYAGDKRQAEQRFGYTIEGTFHQARTMREILGYFRVLGVSGILSGLIENLTTKRTNT